MSILNFFRSPKNNKDVNGKVKFRLMVVEDSQDIISTLELVTFPEHFDIVYIDNAYDALAKLSTQKFDAVLADINMEGMNELNRKLEKMSQDIPVYRMSGQYDRFRNLMLHKPFELKDYKDAVHQMYFLANPSRKVA